MDLLSGSWAVEGEIRERVGSAGALCGRTRIVPADAAGCSGGAGVSVVDF